MLSKLIESYYTQPQTIVKKHIFVHLLNDFSGSPKVLSQVIRAVQDKGGSLELYTGKSEAGFLSGITASHHQYFYKRSENKWMTLLTFISSQIILFLKLLKYHNQDVVIYVNTMLPFGAALAGFAMRKQVVYHIHEISLTPIVLKKFLRSVIKLTAYKIIFVSNAVQASEQIAGKKGRVIHNALSKSFTDTAMKHHLDVDKKVFNVLMLASLKKYKGVHEFLEIARILQLNTTISFTLVLNASKKEVDAFLSVHTISKNIKVASRQHEVIPFYKEASLVLNLSHVDAWVETFGLTIVEAMAFGIPVIVPPVGGPTEIVINGVEGYLISSFETNSIVEKIKALSLNKEEWTSFSKNALKRSRDFNEEVFNKKIIDLLNA